MAIYTLKTRTQQAGHYSHWGPRRVIWEVNRRLWRLILPRWLPSCGDSLIIWLPAKNVGQHQQIKATRCLFYYYREATWSESVQGRGQLARWLQPNVGGKHLKNRLPLAAAPMAAQRWDDAPQQRVALGRKPSEGLSREIWLFVRRYSQA